MQWAVWGYQKLRASRCKQWRDCLNFALIFYALDTWPY